MRYLVLHINCPDQRGIIAQFTGILYDHGANVLHLEQHVEPDERLFFMRIYADLKNMEISENALNDDSVDAVIIMAGSYSDEILKIMKRKYPKINIAVLREYGLEIINN